MKLVTDLHIHSRFSRATSKKITIPNLEKWARIKGVNLLGTGDFTHPKWIQELKDNLTEDDSGVLRTKSGFPFVLSTEISLMYTQDNKGRKIHNVVLAPNFEVVKQITEYLKTHGRVDYDGRPIFGIKAPEFTESLMQISDKIEIIPAHIWTPWFGMLGSKSGFDSIEEGFKDQSKHIHAIETGLSSDPQMNWRLSKLDKYQIVSFSDAHSFWPWRIGREATVFDIKPTYDALIKAIRTGKGLLETVEVDPSYGKYHWDGHRKCGISMTPKQAMKTNNICPVCGHPLTIGVLHRVEKLADRPENYKPKNRPGFKALIPLSELISTSLGIKQLYSKKVFETYNKLNSAFGSEFSILLDASKNQLKEFANEKLVGLILKNRKGEIDIKPGFDGVYGKALLDGKEPEENIKSKPKIRQKNLLDF
ncbi:DNA helicase UvrD [Candidatus Woesearchaeota archaeon]|nr:DNA helicase UvrD [Candidatus Woesearchaeota archaeon]